MAFVILSVGLCKSRKDRLSPARTFVRPAPAAPYGLASSRFRSFFGEGAALHKKTTSTAEVKSADGRFRVGADITVIPRPEEMPTDVCLY